MPIIENEYMCRVCRAKGSFPTYSVREMMFGTRETFSYFQCTHCDCLQITDVPPDLAQYYPPTYYSFGSEFKGNSQGALQRWLQKQRCRTAVFGRGFRMNAIAKRPPTTEIGIAPFGSLAARLVPSLLQNVVVPAASTSANLNEPAPSKLTPLTATRPW